jgi:hypothetical protein
MSYPTRSRSYPVDASSVRSIEPCVRAQDPRSDNCGGRARNFIPVVKQPTSLLVEHPIGIGWQIVRFGDTAGQREPPRTTKAKEDRFAPIAYSGALCSSSYPVHPWSTQDVVGRQGTMI